VVIGVCRRSDASVLRDSDAHIPHENNARRWAIVSVALALGGLIPLISGPSLLLDKHPLMDP
jgi:hypothetical protein